MSKDLGKNMMVSGCLLTCLWPIIAILIIAILGVIGSWL